MHPAEMTDKQLQQAIADKLGWTEVSPSHMRGMLAGKPKGHGSRNYRVEVPNYPVDIAAAMGLLVEFPNFAIYWSDGSDPIMPPGEDKGFSVLIPGRCGQEWDLCKYEAGDESLPRAICEAWLKAKEE